MRKKHLVSRRKFLKQASCAAVGSTTLFSTLLNLKSINAASIFNSTVAAAGDYKALVCILLSGGADAFNMLVPRTQEEYDIYAASRSNQALDRDSLLSINVQNTPGREFGLHPSMSHCRNLFNNGKLAFISNIGTLIQHINKTQFYNGTVPVPLGLYSHADQQMHWQTAVPHDRVAAGWGGKIADLLISSNQNQNISLNLSLSGTNIFQSGNETVEYSLDPYSGSLGFRETWGWTGETQMMSVNSMLDKTYLDPFQQSYKEVVRISRDGHNLINGALENLAEFNTVFSDTYLSESFKMVAKMIAVRQELGMSRQIFFIEYGGWDHHDELLNNQAEMLTELDNALHEFYSVIDQELNLADKVTTFNLSEFSRTLTSNGNGTDHAWGTNVFVLGGAVDGGRILGNYPLLNLGDDNPIEVGGGVLIPTTSADEYFAELAMWFGVPDSELSLLFPNLTNFYTPGSGNPLGFLDLS